MGLSFESVIFAGSSISMYFVSGSVPHTHAHELQEADRGDENSAQECAATQEDAGLTATTEAAVVAEMDEVL